MKDGRRKYLSYSYATDSTQASLNPPERPVKGLSFCLRVKARVEGQNALSGLILHHPDLANYFWCCYVHAAIFLQNALWIIRLPHEGPNHACPPAVGYALA